MKAMLANKQLQDLRQLGSGDQYSSSLLKKQQITKKVSM